MLGSVASRESPSRMRRGLLLHDSGKEVIHSSLVPKDEGGPEGGREIKVAEFGKADC